MARDEQSKGNGRSSGSSGKSGSQDSPLSARRARLRSLARQALPPDPYSKNKDGEEEQADPAAALELKPMDKSAENARAENARADNDDAGGSDNETAPGPQPQDAWLEQSIKLLSPGGTPTTPDPTQSQPPDPSSFTSRSYGGTPENTGPDNEAYSAAPGFQQFPPEPSPDSNQAGAPYNQTEPPSSFGSPPPGFDFGQTYSDGGFVRPPSDLMFSQVSSQQASYSSEPASSPMNAGFAYQPDQSSAAALGIGQPSPPSPSMTTKESSSACEQDWFQSKTSSACDDYSGSQAAPASFDSAPPAVSPSPLGSWTASLSSGAALASSSSSPSGSSTGSEPSSEHSSSSQSDFVPSDDRATTDSGSSSDGSGGFGGALGTTDSGSSSAPISSQVTSRSEQSKAWDAQAENARAEKEESENQQGSSKRRRVPRRSDATTDGESPRAHEPGESPSNLENRQSNDDLPSSSTSANFGGTRPSQSLPISFSNEDPPEKPPTPDWGEVKEPEVVQVPPPPSSPHPSPQATAPVPQVPIEVLTKSQVEALELLTSIDQALGVCAMNLSSIKTTASEQTEALKDLKETLQNQTFFELGLNLNTLMESMSAALEPMKAVGELVPAIDQLVSTMAAREEKEKETRVTPDRLVMALADQLGTGQIDPWTFKCAYMAIYPDEHPADLLHRLVELLGTQRLSGELFRSAYDAVQAAEAPGGGTAGGVREVIKVVQDQEIVKQLEELKRSNEELKRVNEELKSIAGDKDSEATKSLEERETEFSKRLEERELELTKRLEERESEYADLLAAKEQEIQDTQEMLHSRFEEFNSRYEELVETVNQRDEELRNKEDELMRKESEIGQLKAQLDEIKEQFKETVEDMQKQVAATKKQMAEQAQKQAAAQAENARAQQVATPAVQGEERKSSGFFDAEPKSAFLDNGPARPLFKQQMDTFNSMSKLPANAAPPPPTPGPSEPQQMSAFQSTPTGPIPEPSNQAVAKPPQNNAIGPLTQGSYGSGVRAQVFEVIVRQALAGAPWKEICAGPMQVNNITPEEVEAEVRRRETLLKK